MPVGQIRQNGGGRKNAIETNPAIEEAFLQVIEEHIAGDPMDESIRWLKLTHMEIQEKMEACKIKVSRPIIKELMKKHKFVKRRMQRKRSIGNYPNRDQQFNEITSAKKKFMKTNNPIISIDSKKKELVGGNLHREGKVYCTKAIETSDHDYQYLADTKISPHGIYDIKQNKAHINIGISSETAEFICDSLKHWWLNYGKEDYPGAEKILIFCDAGGANSYRHHIFKSELQLLANEIDMALKIVHYPPYTSKWNPIEHRVFPHVTKSIAAIPLNTVEEVKDKIATTKTKTGLTVTADIIKKSYETGKKVAKDFMEKIKIKFGKSIPDLNYTIYPTDLGQEKL